MERHQQRAERKDPFPQIPFSIDDDTSVPGDSYVGVVCLCAAALLLVLGWLW